MSLPFYREAGSDVGEKGLCAHRTLDLLFSLPNRTAHSNVFELQAQVMKQTRKGGAQTRKGGAREQTFASARVARRSAASARRVSSSSRPSRLKIWNKAICWCGSCWPCTLLALCGFMGKVFTGSCKPRAVPSKTCRESPAPRAAASLSALPTSCPTPGAKPWGALLIRNRRNSKGAIVSTLDRTAGRDPLHPPARTRDPSNSDESEGL